MSFIRKLFASVKYKEQHVQRLMQPISWISTKHITFV